MSAVGTARRWAGRATVVFAASLLLLVAIEVVVRVVTYRPFDVVSSAPEVLYYDARPGLSAGAAGDLVPGESLWMIDKTRPYAVVANAHGLRNVEDVASDGERILVVGDSFTFGPFVGNVDTWPAVLERELRNRRPGGRIQVLNAGMAGYSLAQELDYLRAKGLRVRPHAVVLAFYKNDVADLSAVTQERFTRPADHESPLRDLARRSAAVRLAARSFRERAIQRARRDVVTRPAEDAEAHYARYAELFEEFVRAVRGAGAIPFVVAFPEFLQVATDVCSYRPQEHVAGLARQHDVPFLDLKPVFRRYRVDELYLLDLDVARPSAPASCFPDGARYTGDAHLARFGNQVTARAVADWLEANGRLVTKAGRP